MCENMEIFSFFGTFIYLSLLTFELLQQWICNIKTNDPTKREGFQIFLKQSLNISIVHLYYFFDQKYDRD
ncbi:hypothetical protein Gasu2_63140 [Galdieria sulphuraria]|nr:hypothetical protein Gasu2_63140 [Galdieria sulphuraria]